MDKAVQMPPGNTPIWQLTVDQFMALLKSSQPANTSKDADGETHPKRYVHGISGIKSLFNCSYPTAHKLKETIIKPAVHQQGKVIIVDADLAIELFKEHKQVQSLKGLEIPESNNDNNILKQ